jgi:hypothetical protein
MAKSSNSSTAKKRRKKDRMKERKSPMEQKNKGNQWKIVVNMVELIQLLTSL